MVAEVARLSPRDVKGYKRFLRDSHRRYVVGFEGMVAEPMHKAWSTIKVLPEFARLRADRSILGLAKARVKDPRLQMALSFHPLFIGGDPMNVTSMYALVSAGHTYSKLMRHTPRKRWTAPKLNRKRWSMGLFVWYFGTQR